MGKVIKFTLHYIVSLFHYGVFAIPLTITAVVTGVALSSTLTVQDPTNIVNFLTYVESLNITRFLPPLFLIVTVLFNIFLKTKLLLWASDHKKLLLLIITIIFATTYIIGVSNIVDLTNNLWSLWLVLYAATIITTLFGLFTIKGAILIHQIIDSVEKA